MKTWIKKKLYFLVAGYFKHFAAKRLARWNPKVVVVTGSTGKTTAFSLIEAQLGDKAYYSHHANSAFGIPFNILGIEGGDEFSWRNWVSWVVKAPFLVNKPVPEQKIYVAECDCDRPGEGAFLADLLKPEIVLWLNLIATHAMNFDYLVKQGQYQRVEEAIADEFGYFVAEAQELVITSGDSGLIGSQLARANKPGVKVLIWQEKDFLKSYTLDKRGTTFGFAGGKIVVPALLPKAAWLAVAASEKLTEIFNLPFDKKFTHLEMPPGRSSIFRGIRGTTIIDSTYNSSPLAVKEMLQLFEQFKGDKKWLLVGDMLELGEKTAEEHRILADEIMNTADLRRVILLGKNVKKYTAPILEKHHVPILAMEKATELYQYLLDNLNGGETLLFKGAQAGMWEAVIEMILLEPEVDTPKLARRTVAWEKRRQALGLEKIKHEDEVLAGRTKKIKKNGADQNEFSAEDKVRGLNRGVIYVVPGWTYNLDGWREIGKIWERQGWRVKVLRVPGLTGEKLTKAWTLDDYVAWLKKELARSRQVTIVGHSNGGRILLRFAAENPHKIKNLILIDSAGLIDQRWYKKLKRSAGKTAATVGKKLSRDPRLKKLLYKVLRENDYFMAEPVMKQTMANLIGVDLTTELQQIAVPTLLIWGENDLQTPLFQGQKMHALLADSRLMVIDGARHAPQTTEPVLVSSLVEDFIEERKTV